jgi:hypothetical protein
MAIDRKQLGIGLGALRTAIGGAMVVAPGVTGRIWVGPGGTGPGERVFARALGARDVALGLGIMNAAREDASTAEWLKLGVIADLADTAATVLAGRQLVGRRRTAMPLIALAVAGAGAYAVRLAAQQSGAAGSGMPDLQHAKPSDFGFKQPPTAAKADGQPNEMAPLPGTADTPDADVSAVTSG